MHQVYASSLLASNLNADLFMISTAVEKACLNFGKETQEDINEMNVEQAKKYLEEGHFAKGSMEPKVKAILKYLEGGGKEAIITSPEKIHDAILGKTGTHIVP